MKTAFVSSVLIFTCIGCQTYLDSNKMKSFGKFDKNGYETDVWFSRDSSGKILESGQFDSGLMVGNWQYHDPVDDSWKWKPISSPNGNIKTSLPDFLTFEENSDSLIVASSKDTTIGVTVVISNISSIVNSLHDYSDSVFSDLRQRGIVVIDSARQIIETEKGQKFIFHHILCLKPNGNTVQVFDMAGHENQPKMKEITVRCQNKNELFGRRLFYSLVPHTQIKTDF